MMMKDSMMTVLRAAFLAEYEQLTTVNEYRFLYEAIKNIVHDSANVRYADGKLSVSFPEAYKMNAIYLPQEALVVFYRPNVAKMTTDEARLVKESPFVVVPGFVNKKEGVIAELHFAPKDIIRECEAKTFYYEMSSDHYVGININVTLLLNEIVMGYGPHTMNLDAIPKMEGAKT